MRGHDGIYMMHTVISRHDIVTTSAVTMLSPRHTHDDIVYIKSVCAGITENQDARILCSKYYIWIYYVRLVFI